MFASRDILTVSFSLIEVFVSGNLLCGEFPCKISIDSMPIILWAKIENAPHWYLAHKEEQFNMFCVLGVHTKLT